MAAITLVCPKCGRRNDEVRFIEAFCIECYPLKLEAPRSMELERCKKCGKMKLRGEWTSYDEGKIKEYVESKCRGDFSSLNYDLSRQVVEFTITRSGESIVVERNARLEIKTVMCPQCNRISGGYYQAIVQLRGDPEKIREYANLLERKLSKRSFIAKTEEKHEGLDIYIGSSKAVVETIQELKLHTVISKKLVGREQGKRLYRTTFLLRF